MSGAVGGVIGNLTDTLISGLPGTSARNTRTSLKSGTSQGIGVADNMWGTLAGALDTLGDGGLETQRQRMKFGHRTARSAAGGGHIPTLLTAQQLNNERNKLG